MLSTNSLMVMSYGFYDAKMCGVLAHLLPNMYLRCYMEQLSSNMTTHT